MVINMQKNVKTKKSVLDRQKCFRQKSADKSYFRHKNVTHDIYNINFALGWNDIAIRRNIITDQRSYS